MRKKARNPGFSGLIRPVEVSSSATNRERRKEKGWALTRGPQVSVRAKVGSNCRSKRRGGSKARLLLLGRSRAEKDSGPMGKSEKGERELGFGWFSREEVSSFLSFSISFSKAFFLKRIFTAIKF